MRADSAAALALDARSLDALRTRATADPKSAARAAAVQFEALFMQMVVKGMRDAGAALGAQPSAGQDTFTSMLDSQFAQQFSGRPGGLAAMIERQLTRHMGAMPQLPPQPGAPAAQAPAAQQAGPRAEGFVRAMLPHAQEAERRTGVPAAYVLGQAALESGWGRSQPRNADGSASHNIFGIKAGSSWTGATAQAQTTEVVDGRPVQVGAAFRSYASPADAFTDYARLLATQPRYAQAARAGATPETFAQSMQRAGYATDPRYADKLARTIHATLALQRARGEPVQGS